VLERVRKSRKVETPRCLQATYARAPCPLWPRLRRLTRSGEFTASFPPPARPRQPRDPRRRPQSYFCALQVRPAYAFGRGLLGSAEQTLTATQPWLPRQPRLCEDSARIQIGTSEQFAECLDLAAARASSSLKNRGVFTLFSAISALESPSCKPPYDLPLPALRA
jgi:hypothetical protein